MTPTGVTWSSALVQQLAQAIRERLQRLYALRGRLLQEPEIKGRDISELYLNP